MRDFYDRPVHLSKWSNKELKDGLSRGREYLDACGDGSTEADLMAEAHKRGAKKERTRALKLKNKPGALAWDREVQITWSNYSLSGWQELKAALAVLKANTAQLRGSEYQAVHVGIRRALVKLRAGVPPKRVPNRKVSPFIEFWKICLPLGRDIADAQLNKLLAKIYLKREVALGRTPTTLPERL